MATINISQTIRQDRIMHRLQHAIRRARVAKDPKRAAHFSLRYQRLEALGWSALP